ncbi:MAG TPA: ribonuclease HII [Candidatus Eisenbacteria bacterium]|mgnify:CR=1 FL=1|uniref:Ribonuclease HII n=1 Tax=Eiseniibacteriota bacterium TaxID=2212470 RepID=A0A7V2AW67_UNCEI|nr:ribonuclease HII [Candidatus Eisenbacteria bacterium]
MAPAIVYEDLVRFDASRKDLGVRHLAGVDEAGRGALAGPVVAAAVICDPHEDLIRVRDSKLIREPVREELYEAIVALSRSVGVGIVEPDEIDRSNILRATLKAMELAVEGLGIRPCRVLVDGIHRPAVDPPVETVIGGDRRSFSIAAASIVAKVTRDRIMRSIADEFPLYGFGRNKGYGTAGHIDAITRRGLTRLHRRSFKIHSRS